MSLWLRMLFIVMGCRALISDKNENRNVKKNGKISKNCIKLQNATLCKKDQSLCAIVGKK